MTRGLLFACGLAALSSLLVAAPAGSSDTAVRGTKVVPAQPARVFVVAAFDERCRPTRQPEISIVRAPGKGSISYRPNQSTVIQYSASGNCIGTRLSGTGIYYTARAGETGADEFEVRFTSRGGEPIGRVFKVEIDAD